MHVCNADGSETQDNAHHDFLRHDHHEDVVGHPRTSSRTPPTAQHEQLDPADDLAADDDEEFLSGEYGQFALAPLLCCCQTHGAN